MSWDLIRARLLQIYKNVLRWIQWSSFVYVLVVKFAIANPLILPLSNHNPHRSRSHCNRSRTSTCSRVAFIAAHTLKPSIGCVCVCFKRVRSSCYLAEKHTLNVFMRAWLWVSLRRGFSPPRSRLGTFDSRSSRELSPILELIHFDRVGFRHAPGWISIRGCCSCDPWSIENWPPPPLGKGSPCTSTRIPWPTTTRSSRLQMDRSWQYSCSTSSLSRAETHTAFHLRRSPLAWLGIGIEPCKGREEVGKEGDWERERASWHGRKSEAKKAGKLMLRSKRTKEEDEGTLSIRAKLHLLPHPFGCRVIWKKNKLQVNLKLWLLCWWKQQHWTLLPLKPPEARR